MRTAWRYATGGVLIGSAAIIALYFEAYAGMVSVWLASAGHRFLFLVPLLALYFTWRKLPVVAAMRPQPSALGLLYAAAFGLLWLVAEAARLAVAAEVAAVGMLQAVFLTLLGWRLCRVLIFPLALLWLMVPLGDVLVPPLTSLTTLLTVAGLRLVGMPVIVEGNLLTTSSASYAVVPECSGFDFLLGNLLVSLVFAHLFYRRAASRILYVCAAVPVAILANNLRTTGVILVTAATGRSVDLASDHQAFGWVVFFLAMAAQMAVGLRFREPPGAGRETTPAGTGPAVMVVGGALVAIVFVAAIPPAYARLRLTRVPEPAAVQICLPPGMAASAHDPPADAAAWRPWFPQASARVHMAVDMEDRPVELFIAYYWTQGRERELVTSANQLYDGRRWRPLSSVSETALVDGAGLRITATRVAGPGERRRLIWHWYWAGGRFIDGPLLTKLIEARTALLGGDQRSALVAVSAEEFGETEQARHEIQAFLAQERDIGSALERATAGAPGRRCP